MNIKRYIIVVLIVGILILTKMLTLQLTLISNGYNPFSVSEYRCSDDRKIWGFASGDNQKILKVYKSNSYNYVIVGKSKIGIWHIVREGEFSNSDIQYCSIYWQEGIVNSSTDSFDVGFTSHKIFDILKTDNLFVFKLDELPKNIEYTFQESGNSYIIELYNELGGEILEENPLEIEIEDIVSK